MGVRINIDTNNENEFNQQLQIYLSQGYSLQSNFDGTAILKKKSYSVAILILLIIFVFPIGIIYYLVATDDIVTIRNNNGQAPNNNINLNSTTESFDSYCEDCGQGLFKSSKFCPKCGKNLTKKEEDSVEKISKKNVDVEEEVLRCENCGTELKEEYKNCPNCGKNINKEA